MLKRKKLLVAFMLIAVIVALLATVIFAQTLSESEETEEQKETIDTSFDPNSLQVHFLNVGDGDCTFIKFGNNEILIDSGEKTEKTQTIIESIQELCTDKVLEYIIVTHGDSDHIKVMTSIFDYFRDEAEKPGDDDCYRVEKIIDFDSPFAEGIYASVAYEDYATARKLLIDSGTKYEYITELWNNINSFKPIKVSLKNENDETAILHFLYNEYYFFDAASLETQTQKDIYKNVMSICLCVEYGDSKVLLTGDLEEIDTNENPVVFEGETKLINNYPELLKRVTLYKAAHHGSRSSNSENFLSVVNPRYTVISCNAGATKHNFPSQKALDNIFKYSGNTYITGTTNASDTNATLESYYGNVSFSFGKNEESIVTCSKKGMENVPLQDTDWIKLNRTVPTFIIEVSPKEYDNGNCTLIKAGNKELLFNAGLYKNSSLSRSFVDELKRYCRDGIIEYAVVTNAHIDNLSQFPSTYYYDEETGEKISNNDGVFDAFKVEKLIDFGDKTLLSLNNSAVYKEYKTQLREKGNIKYTSADNCMEQKFSLYDFTGEDRDVSFTILKTPAYAEGKKIMDENNNSICMLVEIGDYKALFTGDLNNSDGSEDYLVDKNPLNIKDIDYFKLSNHGSVYANTQSIQDLLDDNCIVVINALCGTNYIAVSSSRAAFPNITLVEDILNRTPNIYATQYYKGGSEYDEMYGTICVTITSLKGEQLKPVTSWSKVGATEETFEEWFENNKEG